LLLPVGFVLLLAVAATQWFSHSSDSDAASKVGPLTVNGSWSAIATFPAVTSRLPSGGKVSACQMTRGPDCPGGR